MSKSRKLSCYLMGHQSRLIQCGELLLEKGHQICGVISDVPSIQEWVTGNDLRLIVPDKDIVSLLKDQAFDVFFSIDNFLKVPDEILTLPDMYAINFHDAPLPRYAGTNATNWALMNGESDHGVTWHVMTNLIDAGDILKQKMVPIANEETALSLNAKCYEASIQCFSELVDELAVDQVKPIQQDLEGRTFFPKWKRPRANCVIDWTRSAEEIDALFRGLNYGSYPNPLGLPKLFLGDDAVIAKQICISESQSNVKAGKIIQVLDGTIRVSTATNEVTLQDFWSLNGKRVSPSEFLERSGLGEGDMLPEIGEDQAHRISELHSKLSKYEEYWIDRLGNMESIDIPYTKWHSLRQKGADYLETRFKVPEVDLASQGIQGNPGDAVMVAFLLYLSRIGGKESFDVNFKDASLLQELADTQMFFASHVPLRIEVDFEQSFKDFHQSLSKQMETTRKYISYARDLVLRDSTLRDIFSHSNTPELTIAVERVGNLDGYQPKSVAELLVVIPDDGKECLWRSDQGTFEESAVSRMQRQFEVLLNDIPKGLDRPISTLSILTDQERQKLLIEWNDTGKDYPQNICWHKLFELQVERTPEAVAVVYDRLQLTYRELNRRANQLARYLRSLGVGPDTLVGLYMERSLEMIIGIYGVLKSGGAYVPLDPEYPPDRVAYMIEDSQIPIILTQQNLLESLPKHEAKVVCLDSEWITIAREKTDNLDGGAIHENLAYVIYTSGSTGKPKGVMNEHRAICNRILWMQDEYGLTESDRVLQKTPFSFDVSVWEFFWPLVVGARLVVARPAGHKDSAYLVKLIIEEEITTLHFVPSMLQIFLEEAGVENCASLKRVICSGEALSYELQKQFFDRLKVELHNLYGPTEAAVDVTYWPCNPETDLPIVPIGFPVANTKIYILDQKLQPVPIGVSGELHIGGVQVARGYLNRHDLTSEKFISDPYSSNTNARLYKTGDLARWLPDGSIEYLGRADFQVKIHGLRIELGEIEAMLRDYEGISQSVVMLREDGRVGDKRLVAYITHIPNHDIVLDEMRKYMRTKLPEYMVPQHFVILDTIPLTPNGKVDRRALPKPKTDRTSDANYVAPRSKVEKKIADIWRELLQVDKVGINDSFFDLGGQSLLLLRMLPKLKESFSEDLSVVDLFQYPTIATFTAFLEQKDKTKRPLAETLDLARKQIASLKQQRRMADARRRSHG
ncbi:MAG: amino acid adenylation domain-containing protein [Deltaproteobacteria bacterium]|nr:MAG: amino acid adenylation domain-containing protein [Deltaproteobacteria bacterium]